MRVLPTYQEILMWLCVRNDKTSPKWQRLDHIVFTTMAIGFMALLCIPSCAFFIKYFSSDLKASLYALAQIAPAMAIIYIMIVAYFIKGKINEIFETLSQIYDNCKNINF